MNSELGIVGVTVTGVTCGPTRVSRAVSLRRSAFCLTSRRRSTSHHLGNNTREATRHATSSEQSAAGSWLAVLATPGHKLTWSGIVFLATSAHLRKKLHG